VTTSYSAASLLSLLNWPNFTSAIRDEGKCWD
jgi:hypothetical protein